MMKAKRCLFGPSDPELTHRQYSESLQQHLQVNIYAYSHIKVVNYRKIIFYIISDFKNDKLPQAKILLDQKILKRLDYT